MARASPNSDIFRASPSSAPPPPESNTAHNVRGPIAWPPGAGGLGGVFVATRELPPAGQRVSLRLALPDWDEPHLLSGEVRWLRGADDNPHPMEGPGMGVKFVKLSLYVAAALDKFVRSHTLGR
ncbi:MAG TPA: PilZ domain-containing protein [Polyangia bacterium]|nr:PilZ domain-containing protein [Polyangia bacterium]